MSSSVTQFKFMKNLFPFACAFIAISIYVSGQASRSTPSNLNLETSPLEILKDKLPPSFGGVDRGALSEALRRRYRESLKDEFETTDAWKSRVAALSKRPLIGSIDDSSSFAFVQDAAKFSYDADNQKMSTLVDLRCYSTGPGGRLEDLQVSMSQPGDFGSDEKYFKYSYPGTGNRCRNELKTVQFSIGADAARLLKPSLRLLVVVKLASPVFGAGSEDFDQYSRFVVDPLQLWIYNYRTGEVLVKQRVLE